jgi:hypothetical protein
MRWTIVEDTRPLILALEEAKVIFALEKSSMFLRSLFPACYIPRFAG